MEDFQSAHIDCDLMDFGVVGRWDTWQRGRFASTNICERLDRVVANQAWWDLFNDFIVSHLCYTISDHCLILINMVNRKFSTQSHGAKQFRFNVDWYLEGDCERVIKEFWLSNSDVLPLKLDALGKVTMKWNLRVERDRMKNKWRLQQRLQEASVADPSDDVLTELIDIQLGLNLEAEKEEIFCEQIARLNWLAHEDCFHKVVNGCIKLRV